MNQTFWHEKGYTYFSKRTKFPHKMENKSCALRTPLVLGTGLIAFRTKQMEINRRQRRRTKGYNKGSRSHSEKMEYHGEDK